MKHESVQDQIGSLDCKVGCAIQNKRSFDWIKPGDPRGLIVMAAVQSKTIGSGGWALKDVRQTTEAHRKVAFPFAGNEILFRVIISPREWRRRCPNRMQSASAQKRKRVTNELRRPLASLKRIFGYAWPRTGSNLPNRPKEDGLGFEALRCSLALLSVERYSLSSRGDGASQIAECATCVADESLCQSRRAATQIGGR